MQPSLSFTGSATLVLLAFAGFALVGAAEGDERIKAAIEKSYVFTTYLKDDAVRTEVTDGVVLLTGQVNEVSHKYAAQEVVMNTPGVVRTDSQLVIKLEGSDKSDGWIKAKVRSVLWLHRIPGDPQTQVDVKEGVITLRGTASSITQRDLATEDAGDVQGVLKVINLMTVTDVVDLPVRSPEQKMDDASVTALVKTTLMTHHSTSTMNTMVQTRNGEVTLIGIARSEAEKALVGRIVANVQGVVNVTNTIVIENE